MSTRISLCGAAACSARAVSDRNLLILAGAVHAVVVAELIRDLDPDDAGPVERAPLPALTAAWNQAGPSSQRFTMSASIHTRR